MRHGRSVATRLHAAGFARADGDVDESVHDVLDALSQLRVLADVVVKAEADRLRHGARVVSRERWNVLVTLAKVRVSAPPF